jgi:hypothetical protein
LSGFTTPKLSRILDSGSERSGKVIPSRAAKACSVATSS